MRNELAFVPVFWDGERALGCVDLDELLLVRPPALCGIDAPARLRLADSYEDPVVTDRIQAARAVIAWDVSQVWPVVDASVLLETPAPRRTWVEPGPPRCGRWPAPWLQWCSLAVLIPWPEPPFRQRVRPGMAGAPARAQSAEVRTASRGHATRLISRRVPWTRYTSRETRYERGLLAMPVLYLHAGHSKTGTSWVQAVLRENTAALAGCGVVYPTFDGIGDERGAEIGQGNGLALAAGPVEALQAGLDAIRRDARQAAVVLSSEEFFPRLSMYSNPGALPQAVLGAGFERVEILLFIRNPVGHAASLWQQYLKRSGGSAPIEAFFEKYSVPERVELFLDMFTSLEGVRLTCLNYDRHRHDLLAPLRAWLGHPAPPLIPSQAPKINRGMTRAELALQAALNRRIGRAGRILSDALCVGLPEQPPDRIYPDPACQQDMCDRLAPTLARVNARLPEAERYRCDIVSEFENADGRGLVFSPEQIELVGAALGSEIRRLRHMAAG